MLLWAVGFVKIYNCGSPRCFPAWLLFTADRRSHRRYWSEIPAVSLFIWVLAVRPLAVTAGHIHVAVGTEGSPGCGGDSSAPRLPFCLCCCAHTLSLSFLIMIHSGRASARARCIEYSWVMLFIPVLRTSICSKFSTQSTNFQLLKFSTGSLVD